MSSDIASSYVVIYKISAHYLVGWPFERVDGFVERGYYWLCYLAGLVFTYNGFIFLVSLFSLTLISSSYKKLSVNYLLSMSCYIYYFTQYNIEAIRELLAFSIMFFAASRFILVPDDQSSKRSSLYFFLSLLVACSFHNSSFASVVYYVARKVVIPKVYAVYILIFAFIGYMFSFFAGTYFTFVLKFVPNHAAYTLGARNTVGVIYLFYYMITMLYVLFEKQLKCYDQYESIKNILLVGCVLFGVLFRFGFMGRLSVYFFIFLPVAIAQLNQKIYRPIIGFVGMSGYSIIAINYMMHTYGF